MAAADPSSHHPPEAPPPSTPPPTVLEHHFLAPRPRRQFSFFLLGAACVSLSIFSTRRALLRRYLSTIPEHFFQPSNAPPRQAFSLQKEAFEALRIATVNVLSFAALAT
ncbi:MAG: hypothetical protein Q9222_005065, partial [Ikaeria aurantiellina]